jgi:23S rRNA (adenine2503-C2)-methyltransferase
MQSLFGKTVEELRDIAGQLGLPVYASRQIADWLYRKQVLTVSEMTNLSLKNRDLLSERFVVGRRPCIRLQRSVDGTVKYLFHIGAPDAAIPQAVETVAIPEAGDGGAPASRRLTVCVSSQVGCKLGCRFCMTGKQGFHGQLSTGDILNQLVSIEEHDRVSNIVFMGMGEPFDNTDAVLSAIRILTAEWGMGMSAHRITVSTVGVLPGLKRFLVESSAHLAISLHSPFAEERRSLVPAQAVWPLSEVLTAIRGCDFGHQRRVSFEYIVFHGLNDTPRHSKELARILNGLRCRINLLRFHEIPGISLPATEEASLLRFRDSLVAKGIVTTIRASRGQDIAAACGMLAGKGE